MGECVSCHQALEGAWQMTAAGQQYGKTGRFLGIKNGYFLFGENPNWVYCYCYTCWKAEVLRLSFVESLAQEKTNVQQQLTTLQEQYADLQNQFNTLKNDLVGCNKQLSKVIDQSKKFPNEASVDKLRSLLEELTNTQADTIHSRTSFRIDTFGDLLLEKLKQCSREFVSTTVVKLKGIVNEILLSQNETLSQRRTAKDIVFETLTNAGVDNSSIGQSVKPLENEITELQSQIVTWETFISNLDGCTSP